MELKVRLLSLRNSLDYPLRTLFRFSKAIDDSAPIPGTDFRVQNEFREFLELFPWTGLLSSHPKESTIEIADVGARNFCFGPVLDEYFRKLGRMVSIYGIELDAFRRLANLHTRYDYGLFYARQCRQAEFHAMDFLKWQKPVDIAFLLNPFVTEEPTVYWGLPLSKLKPNRFFSHAYTLLKPRSGIAILSSPSIEEFELGLEFAEQAGFKTGAQDEEVVWRPQEKSQQRKPRYGIVLHT